MYKDLIIQYFIRDFPIFLKIRFYLNREKTADSSRTLEEPAPEVTDSAAFDETIHALKDKKEKGLKRKETFEYL